MLNTKELYRGEGSSLTSTILTVVWCCKLFWANGQIQYWETPVSYLHIRNSNWIVGDRTSSVCGRMILQAVSHHNVLETHP